MKKHYVRTFLPAPEIVWTPFSRIPETNATDVNRNRALAYSCALHVAVYIYIYILHVYALDRHRSIVLFKTKSIETTPGCRKNKTRFFNSDI